MTEENQGASGKPDRAVAASPSSPSVSPLRASIPSADATGRTALSYWFPKIEAAGLPVPRTAILAMPEDAQEAIGRALWGEEADCSPVEAFVGQLRYTAAALGGPFFLRTDDTSGKHEWRHTCYVENLNELSRHVFALAEFSALADFMDLPIRNWVVRELLPTMPVGVCPRYGGMPVCKEFRFFVDGEKIECWHPYWPRHALEQGGCNLSDEEYAALSTSDNEDDLRSIASRAGRALGGRWSVDLLATERGWFLTDMAAAELSYHWPGCPAQAIEARRAETRSGSVHESAVAAGDAPEPSPDSPHHGNIEGSEP